MTDADKQLIADGRAYAFLAGVIPRLCDLAERLDAEANEPCAGCAVADGFEAALEAIKGGGQHAFGCREVGPACDCGLRTGAVRFAHEHTCAVAGAHERGLIRMDCAPGCPTAMAARALRGEDGPIARPRGEAEETP